MLAFPQFANGSGAQYPLSRVRIRRTVRNVLADGTQVKYGDSGAATVAWNVSLRALSTIELKALQDLFVSTEGRLRSFTLVDPASNLLAWSGHFDKPVWQRDPMLGMQAGVADPAGGLNAVAVVNAGQAAQRLSQTLDAPGWFQYCMSVYARSAGGGKVSLARSCATASQRNSAVLDSNWRRIVSSGSLGGLDATITFGIEIEAGAGVELFGCQVEAQPGASAYMQTGPASGVYSNSRFDQDELISTAQGPDVYDAGVRIVSADGV
jgi:hypothetical protein